MANKANPVSISDSDSRWRAESDLSTYTQWCQIKKDPKRLAALKKLAKERLKEMQVVVTTSTKEK